MLRFPPSSGLKYGRVCAERAMGVSRRGPGPFLVLFLTTHAWSPHRTNQLPRVGPVRRRGAALQLKLAHIDEKHDWCFLGTAIMRCGEPSIAFMVSACAWPVV